MQTKPFFLVSFFVCLLFFISFFSINTYGLGTIRETSPFDYNKTYYQEAINLLDNTSNQKLEYINDGYSIETWDSCYDAYSVDWYNNPIISYYPDGAGDDDWFKYSGSGPYIIELTMSAGSDFDVYVYDSCGASYLCRPYKGTSSKETCYVDISTSNFYVKINAFSIVDAYSWYELLVIPNNGHRDYCSFLSDYGSSCARNDYDCDSSTECSTGHCAFTSEGDGLDGCCYASEEWNPYTHSCYTPCTSDGYSCSTPGTSTIECCSGMCNSAGYCGTASNGDICYIDQECSSGNCVHNVCRSSDPYCGDGYCDLSEYCPSDCCTDECILGTYSCSGSTQQKCYDSDGDGCTEWTGVASCAYGCSNGACLDYCDTNRCGDGTCNCGETYNTCNDCKKSNNNVCSVDAECLSGYCVHGICRLSDPYCGDSWCDYGEIWQTCSDCCKSDGVACSTPGTSTAECCSGMCNNAGYCGTASNGDVCSIDTECSSGNCVHGVCRATSTYCGDGYCDVGETDSSCSFDCYANIEAISIISSPTTAISDDLVPVTVRFKNTGTYTGSTNAELSILPISWSMTSTEYSTQTSNYISECCLGNTYYDAVHITLGVGVYQDIIFYPKAPNPSSIDSCDSVAPIRSAWGSSHNIFAGTYSACGSGYTSQTIQVSIIINSCGNNICDGDETYSTCSSDCCISDGNICSTPGTSTAECCSGMCNSAGYCGIASNGDVCSIDAECDSGYCVHDVCRATSTYCGDTHCDVGETYSSCSTDCPGCHGIIYTTVLDQYSNPLSGYGVYSNSGYDGITDSFGKKRSDVYLDSCGAYTDITVRYPDNTICETRSTEINYENDYDYLTFTCVVEKPNLYVDLYLDKSAYYLFDLVRLTANVRDINGNSINAQTAIYDPYLFTTTLPTYTSQYTYDGQIKSTGCYDFIVSATNPNYNSVNQKITICSSDYSGKIRVFVKETGTNIALSDVSVYDSTIYKGITNIVGNIDFSATRGSHTVNAYCPSTTNLCVSESVNIDYNGEIETINLECDCTKDSDGDGYTDDDELLMGTNPYESLDNFGNMLTDYKYSTACFDPFGFLSIFATKDQQLLLKENLESLDVGYLSSSYNEHDFSTLKMQVVNSLNVDESQIIDKPITLMQAFETSDKIKHVTTDKGVFIIVTNTTTGKTSIFMTTAHCSGILIGLISGAGYGVRDDLVFIYDAGSAVVQGALYFADNWKNIGGIIDEIISFIWSIDLSGLFGSLGDMFHEWIITIFNRGQYLNPWSVTGTQDYAVFQVGYFQGYVTGYVVEQAVLLGKVSGAFKSFKAGAKLGDISNKVLRAMERVANGFGQPISSAMKKSALGVKILDTGTDLAQDGYALLVKTMKLPGETYAKATERVDAFLKPATLGAEAVAERVGRLKIYFSSICSIAPSTTTVSDCGELIIQKLSNSIIGKKALTEWTEVEVKGLGKAFTKYTPEFMETLLYIFKESITKTTMRGIDNNVIKVATTNPNKLAKYVKITTEELKIADPMVDTVGIHQLLKMIKSSDSSMKTIITEVKDGKIVKVYGTVDGVAILKKGKYVEGATDNFGLEKIIGKHSSDFAAKFSANTKEEIIKIIEEGIETGLKKGDVIEKTFKDNPCILRIVLSPIYPGSITTAYPVC